MDKEIKGYLIIAGIALATLIVYNYIRTTVTALTPYLPAA